MKLAAAFAAGVGLSLIVAAMAGAFAYNCNNGVCSGTGTDSTPQSIVCYPGTSTYFEDSYIPQDAENPHLTNFTVEPPDPPCTGATISQPTAQSFPASPQNPDDTQATPGPGDATFRFTWTVYVPPGSTPVGNMNVSWSLSWTLPPDSTSPTSSTGSTASTGSAPGTSSTGSTSTSPSTPACEATLTVSKRLGSGIEAPDRLYYTTETIKHELKKHQEYVITVTNTSKDCVARGVRVHDLLPDAFDCKVVGIDDGAGQENFHCGNGKEALSQVGVAVGDLGPGKSARVILGGFFTRRGTSKNVAHAGGKNAGVASSPPIHVDVLSERKYKKEEKKLERHRVG